jgi:hypothetical protein
MSRSASVPQVNSRRVEESRVLEACFAGANLAWRGRGRSDAEVESRNY